MNQLIFTIAIEAAPDSVWNTLWNHDTYSQWTSVFQEGSRYEGTLEEGSIIRMFDSNNNGMYNLVLINRPTIEMKFKHLGWLYDGAEDPQQWEDSVESYQLESTGMGTQLKVEVNAIDEFVEFFNNNLPKALTQIKNIAEK